MALEFIQAVGRRKTSVARVHIKSGNGDVLINKKTLDTYFGEIPTKGKVLFPLVLTGHNGKIDLMVNVKGGGTQSQIGAIAHGLSRALVKLDPELRSKLKKEGLLTRDPRVKERKKYGQKGARARYQYSKR